VPFIARWPGHIAAKTTVTTPLMSVDLLPTLAKAAGAPFTPAGAIDGVDILPWLTATAPARDPHEAIYYYGGFGGTELHAVRSGPWKLHVPHPYVDALPGNGGTAGTYVPKMLDLSLFDVTRDPGETTNVAGANPEVVTRLLALIERARADLGDSLTKRTGAGVRAPGRLP
jgi:arylsulfatase